MGGYGLYIHVPFCTTKCGYCDFYSIPAAGRDTGGLVDRLRTELHSRLASIEMPVTTIFIGGGTPTVLPADQLAALVEIVAATARQDACREFTVEANPATLDEAKADILVSGGVTRLSLGAQSFHQLELAVLERIHHPEDVAPAVATARAAGIASVNLDLIFGIPGQSVASWGDSLRRALDLAPDHLALYGLMYEPGTVLTRQRERGQVTPCDDGLEADMYRMAVATLADAGFEQYEISNFAKPGHRCLHNLQYWKGDPYVGIGPSAVGCVGDQRYRNVPDAARYVRMIDEQGSAVIETEHIDERKRAAETVMLQLRLIDGIDIQRFGKQFGIDPGVTFANAIARHAPGGLVTTSGSHIALTNQGRLYADTIIADFMAELDAACHA